MTDTNDINSKFNECDTIFSKLVELISERKVAIN